MGRESSQNSDGGQTCAEMVRAAGIQGGSHSVCYVFLSLKWDNDNIHLIELLGGLYELSGKVLPSEPGIEYAPLKC